MNLTELLSLGASLFGSSQGAGAGGGQSGFLSSLLSSGPSTSTSPTSSTDWGSILSAIGQTAGQFKATPRAGASRKDIEKANRINLLTGLLGGGAQIAGGLMSQQRKGEAYSALGDILGGKATATGQPITPSEGAVGGVPPTVVTEPQLSEEERIAGLIKQYPDLGKELFDINLKRQEARQKQYLEELKAAQKGIESPQTRQARAAYYAQIGEPQAAIPQLIERDIAEEAAARESRIEAIKQKYGRGTTVSPALRGLGGVESMAAKPTIATPGPTPSISAPTAQREAPTLDTEQFPEMYRGQAEEAAALLGGKNAPVEVQQEPSQMLRGEAATPTPTPTTTRFQEDEILQRLEGQQATLADQKSAIEGKPTKSIDDYRQLQRINADLSKVEGQLPQVRAERDKKYQAVREEINRISTPYAKVLSKGARANDLNATIKQGLNQNTRFGDELAIKTLIQSIDDSVVHPTEQAAALASLLSKRDQLVRLGQSYLGINEPLRGAIKNQLVKLADDIRNTSLQSYRRAEDAITNVAIRRVQGDFSARLSDFDQQYTTVGDIAGQIGQPAPGIRGITTQPQSLLAGLSPTPTATPTPRTRRIVSVEPVNP